MEGVEGYLAHEVSHWRRSLPELRQPDANLLQILNGQANHNLQVAELRNSEAVQEQFVWLHLSRQDPLGEGQGRSR